MIARVAALALAVPLGLALAPGSRTPDAGPTGAVSSLLSPPSARMLVVFGTDGVSGGWLTALPLLPDGGAPARGDASLDVTRALWTLRLDDAAESALLMARPNNLAYHERDLHGYRAFARDARGRPLVLLTASASGLRAFDAGTGKRVFFLAREPAAQPGREARSSPFTYDDAYVNAAWAGGGSPCPSPMEPGEACQWRTLAVGRLGAEWIALDVTRPDSPGHRGSGVDCVGPSPASGCSGAYGKQLWSVPASGAESVAAPAVGRVRLSRDGAAAERFVAFLPGGHAGRGWVDVVDIASGRSLLRVDHAGPRVARDTTGRLARSGGEGMEIGEPSGVAALDETGDGVLDRIYFVDTRNRLFRAVVDGPTIAAALVYDGAARAAVVPGRPAVARLGRDPGTGEDLLAIAWSVESDGKSRVVAVVDPGARAKGPLDSSSLRLVDGPAAAQAGACGTLGPAFLPGWSFELPAGQRVAGPVLVIGGYVYVLADGAARRVHRLALENGDGCAGADCCEDPSGRWSGRTLRQELPGAAGSAGSLFVYVDPRGVTRVGALSKQGRSAFLTSFPVLKARLRNAKDE